MFYAVQIFGWPHVGQKRVFASRVAPQVGQTQLVGAYRVTGEPQFGQNVYPLSTAAPQVWQIVRLQPVLPVQRVRRSGSRSARTDPVCCRRMRRSEPVRKDAHKHAYSHARECRRKP